MQHVTMLTLVQMVLILMEVASLGLKLMIAIELLRIVNVVDNCICVEMDLLLMLLLHLGLRMDGWCKHNAEESGDVVFYVAVQRQAHCFQYRQDCLLEHLALIKSSAYHTARPLYNRSPTLLDLTLGQHLLIVVLSPSIHEKCHICHCTLL